MTNRENLKHSELMEPFRKKIDDLDKVIIKLFGQRMGIMREVALFKYDNGIESTLPDRVEMVKDHASSIATEHDLNPDMVRDMYAIMIKESCKVEENIIQNIKLDKIAGK